MAVFQFQKAALTCDPAMKPMEANRRIMEETTPREPMTRVPVFREAHAQQLRSFGRATIFVKRYLKSREGDQSPGTNFLNGPSVHYNQGVCLFLCWDCWCLWRAKAVCGLPDEQARKQKQKAALDQWNAPQALSDPNK